MTVDLQATCQRLRELLEKATPKEWIIEHTKSYIWLGRGKDIGSPGEKVDSIIAHRDIENTRPEYVGDCLADYTFIAESRNALSALLDALDNARVCETCGGNEYIEDMGTDHHPHCDGSCADNLCPVPVRIQVQCPDCRNGVVFNAKEQADAKK